MRKPIKYIYKENYFEKIDSSQKAYFLGFLYADGCNHIDKSGNKRSISISLKLEDGYILDMFRGFIGGKFSEPLKDMGFGGKGRHHISLLQINNKKISIDLENIGMVPRKSLVLKFPKVRNKFVWHFIRGYFDGDGCLHVAKK